MIKGWRNNPDWVMYFEAKRQTKIQRVIHARAVAIEIAKWSMESDMAIRRNLPYSQNFEAECLRDRAYGPDREEA